LVYAAYIVDPKNCLVAEITYNVNNLKRGMFNFKSESPDFLSGELFRVSQAFVGKFLASKKKLCPRKDEESVSLSRI
jgi:hypothetical protein